MNKRKRLLVAAAVFIFLMFLGVSIQGSIVSHTNHNNTISMSDQISKGNYMNHNPSSMSDNLSNLFNSWLMNTEHSDNIIERNDINSKMPETS